MQLHSENSVAVQETIRPEAPNVTKLLFFMHMIRASIGIGILALPSAISNAGIVLGTVGIAVISAIIIFCIHLLVDCAQFLRDTYNLHHVFLDYGNTGVYVFVKGAAWGRRLRWSAKWLDFCMAMAQFGGCTVYMLFVSENIKYVVDFYAKDFKKPVLFYLGCVAACVLPLIFIRTVRNLARISVVANFVMFAGLALMVQYCCRDIPDVSKYPLIVSVERWPLFFSITVFSFESINAVLITENATIDKRSLLGWNGLINLSLGMVLIMYVTVGFYGYIRFGADVKGSLTYSMPMTPWYYMIIKPIYAVLVALSFGLQYQILVEVVWKGFVNNMPMRFVTLWGNLVLRLAIFVIMFGVAAVVPHVEQMISLTGALTGSCLCLIFPPLLHSVLFWNEPSRHKACGCFALYITRNMSIMAFGMIGCFIGTTVSVIDIVRVFRGENT